MKKIFLIVVLSLVAKFALTQSREDEVWQRAEALNKSVFETKDSTALVDLLSDKVTYGHSGGNVEDKHLMIKNAVANTATYKGITIEKISVQHHKKTVVVRHLLRATTVDKGNESPLNLHLLQVWSKEKGKWKLVARQAVRINPA